MFIVALKNAASLLECDRNTQLGNLLEPPDSGILEINIKLNNKLQL